MPGALVFSNYGMCFYMTNQIFLQTFYKNSTILSVALGTGHNYFELEPGHNYYFYKKNIILDCNQTTLSHRVALHL